MVSKKNPKADLDQYSSIFFLIGLTLVLFVTWRLLEMKTYKTEDSVIHVMALTEEVKEDIPITETVNTMPPPPPPTAPVVIEVVEDAMEIEETVIGSTETDQDEAIGEVIVDVSEVEVMEEEDDISVPFAVIEDVPVFPGCEGGTKAEQRACFQQKMQEHISTHFKYPKIAMEMGLQGRVYVHFVIDSKGNIIGIRTRGPHDILEKEAHRIIAALPHMTPGRQRGRSVKVPYSIPINFKLL